jgi:hypothetical protein
MSDFDYSKDIAPLRGNYFNDPRLTDRERTSLRSGYMRDIDPLIKAHQDLDNLESNKRRDELAYQSGLLTLRKQKQGYRRERQENNLVAEVADTLKQVFDDPTADTSRRARAVTDVAAKYAGSMSDNGPIAQTLRSFSERMAYEDAEAQRKHAEGTAARTAQEEAAYEAARGLAASGAPIEGVTNVLDEADVPPNTRRDLFIASVKGTREALLNQKKESTAAAAQLGQANATQERSDEQREAAEEFVRGVRFLGADEIPPTTTTTTQTGGNRRATRPSGPPPLTLATEDRTHLRTLLTQVYGVPLEGLPETDEDLYKMAVSKSYE